MAKWKNAIDVVDAFSKARARECDAKYVATEIASKLILIRDGMLKYVDEFEFDNMVDEFMAFEGDFDDLDEILADLYDMADTDHVLWVKTV